MYEKMSERSAGTCIGYSAGVTDELISGVALDDRIDDIAEQVQSHYNLPDLGDPSAETEVRY